MTQLLTARVITDRRKQFSCSKLALGLHFQLAASRLAGRYHEALAIGKQFVARHPDYFPTHIHLAFCYADLDQLEEGRAEGREMLRLNPMFTLAAFERHWPMKDPAVLERHIGFLNHS